MMLHAGNDIARDRATTNEAAVQRHIAMRDGGLDSSELFGALREIAIRHGDSIYRLRLTSQNRLILTK